VDGKTSSQDLLDHNLAGTIHLLEHCRRHDAGFILLSTSRVYSIEPLAGLPMEFVAGAFVPKWSALSAELKGAISNQGVRENFPTDPPSPSTGLPKNAPNSSPWNTTLPSASLRGSTAAASLPAPDNSASRPRHLQLLDPQLGAKKAP
jgi:hypothetical protein